MKDESLFPFLPQISNNVQILSVGNSHSFEFLQVEQGERALGEPLVKY